MRSGGVTRIVGGLEYQFHAQLHSKCKEILAFFVNYSQGRGSNGVVDAMAKQGLKEWMNFLPGFKIF